MKQEIKEKREKLISLWKQVSRMTAEERRKIAETMPIVNCEGHSLSYFNHVIIYLENTQNISVTVVGGYKQWQRMKRQVKKGEHGFGIMFPKTQKHKDEEGNTVESEPEAFYWAYVFDISQTEEIKPELPEEKGTFEENVEMIYGR